MGWQDLRQRAQDADRRNHIHGRVVFLLAARRLDPAIIRDGSMSHGDQHR